MMTLNSNDDLKGDDMMTYNDNIIIRKIWQDSDMVELRFVCLSPIVSVKSQIYVSDLSIDNLIGSIRLFLENYSEERTWTSGKKGNDTLACLSLRFIKKDNLGHIAVEIYAEIDDGGDYSIHNCCFFVNTEYGLLEQFCNKLTLLKDNAVGNEIQLNDF